MSDGMIALLALRVWETLPMTFISGFFVFVIGMPIGVLLYVSRSGQIVNNAKLYRMASALVNILRSFYYSAGLDDSVYPYLPSALRPPLCR